MGSDIHAYVEQLNIDGTWEQVAWAGDRPDYVTDDLVEEFAAAGRLGPFARRFYGVFGFLGHEDRNYSRVPPLAPLRGLPPDLSPQTRKRAREWQADGHSHSWLSAQELADFDYSQPFENLRTSVTSGSFTDGAVTTDPGLGEDMTFRDFLGTRFFADLATLTAMNQVRPARIVFWFDC